MKTLDRIRQDSRVERVDLGDDGPILTLKKGYSFDPKSDNRVRGEDTLTALRTTLTLAKPYAGPYDE